LSASSLFSPPLVPRFFRFFAVDFGNGFFGVDFGAGFFGGDFGAGFFGGDAHFFGGDLGAAARFLGEDFGVAAGEFPAPPDLVVIGDMVS
jgi:hypothetical protein